MSLINQNQHILKKIVITSAWLISSLVGLSAIAASVTPVPYTFTDGTSANASQMNADFNSVVNQIAELRAQLAALQPMPAAQAIIGTYDLVQIESKISSPQANGYQVDHSSGVGSVTFTAGGQVTGSVDRIGNYLYISNQIGFYTGPGNYSYIQAGITQNNATDSISTTYTLSGSTVNIVGNKGPITGIVSPDGKIIIISSHNGSDGMFIGIKR